MGVVLWWAALAMAADWSPPLRALIGSAAAEGLPAEALERRAREGVAKRVPEERLVAVLEVELASLRHARALLGDAPADQLVAAGRAHRAALSDAAILRAAAHGGPRPLLALCDLVDVGLPEAEAARLVEAAAARNDVDAAFAGIATAASSLLDAGLPAGTVVDRLTRAIGSGGTPFGAVPPGLRRNPIGGGEGRGGPPNDRGKAPQGGGPPDHAPRGRP